MTGFLFFLLFWNNINIIHLILFLNIFYCCSTTVFCFSPQPSPPPQPSPLPPLFPPPPHCYCPCVLYNCSFKPFTLSPYNPLPSPLWSLSACSQFQCLWLYFACLFILLIRFPLKVRSYGICLSPSGLFHLG